MIRAGDKVVYAPRDTSGIIYKQQKGIVKRLAPDGKRAFVWYHSGCTASGTKLSDLLFVHKEAGGYGNIHRGCEECQH